MTQEVKCTRYTEGDWVEEGLSPCHCPVCGGFLAWEDDYDNELNEIVVPICNKCKTPLIALPDYDEETREELEWGRICPIPKAKG